MKWVNEQVTPNWDLLPLTHITRGVIAEDVIEKGRIEPTDCKVFGEPLAYFFYGRPAYRIAGEGVIKAEALCPYCFVFKPDLIDRAKAIHAFDTGAFERRMYSGVISDDMNVNDFRLEGQSAPKQLIFSVFGSQEAYFNGDTRVAAAKPPVVQSYQFHAKSYIDLVLSPGRNEPDDRIYSIEVVFGDPVPLSGSLLAIALPHTLWSDGVETPWLKPLVEAEVEILPYEFLPGRPPEHYHTLLEKSVREFYRKRRYL